MIIYVLMNEFTSEILHSVKAFWLIGEKEIIPHLTVHGRTLKDISQRVFDTLELPVPENYRAKYVGAVEKVLNTLLLYSEISRSPEFSTDEDLDFYHSKNGPPEFLYFDLNTKPSERLLSEPSNMALMPA